MRCLFLTTALLAAGCAGDAVDGDDNAADTDQAATTGDTGLPPTTDQVTWTNFSEGFFDEYCVSCHKPQGQASTNFKRYDVVSELLNPIRCGVAPDLLDGCEGEHPPGWFPVGAGPFPTEDERWTLVEWIDNGAPE